MEEEDQGEWPSKTVTTVQQAHAVTQGLYGSSSVVHAHEKHRGTGLRKGGLERRVSTQVLH